MRSSLIAIGAVLFLVFQAQAGIERPHKQNLPMVVDPRPTSTPTTTNTATATSTATPTRTATPTQNPVTLWPNGDFEQGPVEWQSQPMQFITTTTVLPVVPRSGDWVARYDQDFNSLYRNVTVPTNAPYMSYWVWVRSTEPVCGRNIFGFTFIPPGGSPVVSNMNLCIATQTDGWVNHVFDLSAMAGQTVYVEMNAGTSVNFPGSVWNSAVYVDDIGWRATP